MAVQRDSYAARLKRLDEVADAALRYAHDQFRLDADDAERIGLGLDLGTARDEAASHKGHRRGTRDQ